MKLEVGKYYRMRYGLIVGPMRDDFNTGGKFRWHVTSGNWHNMLWDENGIRYDGDTESPEALIAEAYPEQGTLKEIGAKPGDVVAASWKDKQDWIEYTYVKSHPKYGFECLLNNENGESFIKPEDEHLWHWRIVKRADESNASGPVREVTRKEVVPGVYGVVDVGGVDAEMVQVRLEGSHVLKTWFTAAELTAAIQTLQEIRDALEQSS